MTDRRVVVTGLGIISPLGHGLNENWENLAAGNSGISHISLFDTSDFACKIAGEIDSFDPSQFIHPRKFRRMDRFIQLSMVAGADAVKDSGLNAEESDAGRIGVNLASGIGGVNSIEDTTEQLNEKGSSKVSPFYIPMSIANMASGNLSLEHGFRGPTLCFSTACAAGTHAIGDAARYIRMGDVDAMVAGGTEAAITRTSVAGFWNARALSRRTGDPKAASRPFDADRDGFVLGEGSGVLVLEELEHAQKRGANIYAELLGFGMSSDAYHITAPSPSGDGAAACMKNALQDGRTNPEEINHVNAHGTSTKLGDAAETMAIKNVFGDQARKLSVSATKSMTGHLLGAAGGIEAVYTVQSLVHQVAPPTINLDTPDPECDLDYVPGEARETTINYALSNSFGFGGTNASLLFKRFSD